MASNEEKFAEFQGLEGSDLMAALMAASLREAPEVAGLCGDPAWRHRVSRVIYVGIMWIPGKCPSDTRANAMRYLMETCPEVAELCEDDAWRDRILRIVRLTTEVARHLPMGRETSVEWVTPQGC